METIFTILIIILPIVFKLIGKKLEQAGQQNAPQSTDNQEQIEDWAEVLRRHIEAQQMPQEPELPVQEERIIPDVRLVAPKAKPSVVQPKPVILAEPEEEEKEKIDKKKLILYSEIMKPKYKEE
ncbi:MAG: hypothetical protein E7116_03750 [Bacteroidales bacterium]|nr:hypothetical protein [Bacteroidales bacterium]